MEKSITSQWTNNSLREGRKKKQQQKHFEPELVIYSWRKIWCLNIELYFYPKTRLQNVPDLTITSFSLKFATRTSTWRSSVACLTVCWLAGFPFHYSLLLSLFSRKSGLKTYFKCPAALWLPKTPFNKSGNFSMKVYFSKTMRLLSKLKTKQDL